MSAFLYFFPRLTDQVPSGQVDKLPAPAAAELTPVLAGASWSCAKLTTESPAGQVPGMLLAVEPGEGGAASTPAYLPARQEWRAAVGPEGAVTHYLGWEIAQPPAPADLRRPEACGGYLVRVHDQQWAVPGIRAAETHLPRGFNYQPGAAEPVTLTVYPRYAELVALAARWRAALHEARTRGDAAEPGAWLPTLPEAFLFAVQLLAVNYRLGPREAGLGCLDLVNTSTVWTFVFAAVGWLEAADEAAAQKKNRHTGRWLVSLAWRSGLLPGHAPTWVDLEWLADPACDPREWMAAARRWAATARG